MFEKRIVVVGGSIAGCAITILLQRLGFKTVLLERSVGLTNRGAGITLPESLVHQCIELNLFDTTIPHFTASSRSFSQKDSTSEHDARQFWRQSLNVVTLN